jgi:hypothetical protein
VGHSKDPVARLRQFQTGSDAELELVATLEGGQDLESRIHAAFAADQVLLEWFQPSMGAVAEAVRDSDHHRLRELVPEPELLEELLAALPERTNRLAWEEYRAKYCGACSTSGTLAERLWGELVAEHGERVLVLLERVQVCPGGLRAWWADLPWEEATRDKWRWLHRAWEIALDAEGATIRAAVSHYSGIAHLGSFDRLTVDGSPSWELVHSRVRGRHCAHYREAYRG